MNLFDVFFYTAILLFGYSSFRLLRSKNIDSIGKKIGRGFIFFVTILLLFWQLAIWLIPKGNKVQEAVNLPRHFWGLEHAHLNNIEDKGRKISYGKDDKQYLMYYPAPTNSSKKNTIIFYWHGGGWHTGRPYQHRHLAALLHQLGYTVVMPAYRLGPRYGYYEIQEDVDNAFDFSLKLLKKEGIENYKLIMGGTSAGSNLAALLAYDDSRWEKLGLDRNKLLGYFGIVSVLDLNRMAPSQVIQNYAGTTDSEQFQLANPISFVSTTDTFPALLLHGTKDGLASIQNVQSFYAELKKQVSNDIVSLHTFENKTHLEVGSIWYYDEAANYGQDSILADWLEGIGN